MKKLSLALILITMSSLAQAHEGHDKTPGALAAPHGGSVQGTKDFYLELVATKGGVKLYPLDHDSKPIPLNEFSVGEGTVKFPRKDKGEKIAFTADGADHYAAKVDAKGAYRYTLEVLAARKGAKGEKVKFNVEPK